MQITVHFLGSLRHSAGVAECLLELPDGTNLEQAAQRLVSQYPALAGHQASWHFAINQTHAEADSLLHPNDAISIFPYIAGG